MNALVDQFRTARLKSTPLIGIEGPDPGNTIEQICGAINGRSPKIVWDAIRGMRGLNDAGSAAIVAALPTRIRKEIQTALSSLDTATEEEKAATQEKIRDLIQKTTARLEETLALATNLPGHTVLFVSNPGKYLRAADPKCSQAVWNLRDPFKSDFRTLVLLGHSLELPPELSQDVVMFREPLPSREQLRTIVVDYYNAALQTDTKLPQLTDETVGRVVDALRGVAAFPAEQIVAINTRVTGIDLDGMWEHKRQLIDRTPALKVYRGPETFDALGGLSNLKMFARRILHGRAQPKAVVFCDEMDKGFVGDHEVSQELLQMVLTFMQNTVGADPRAGVTGFILLGPPGTGKSAIAKAMGNEGNVLGIEMNLAGTKSKWVGESTDRFRQTLDVVAAVSDNQPFFVGAMNQMVIRPELARRFGFGVFYVDLPDEQEKPAIWNVWLQKYDIRDQERPKDEGWSGDNIRRCCEISWRLDCSLIEASAYIVPIGISARDDIASLRSQANGRFTSASYGGPYRSNHSITTLPTPTPAPARRHARAAAV